MATDLEKGKSAVSEKGRETRVFELFAGIGGMHRACQLLEVLWNSVPLVFRFFKCLNWSSYHVHTILSSCFLARNTIWRTRICWDVTDGCLAQGCVKFPIPGGSKSSLLGKNIKVGRGKYHVNFAWKNVTWIKGKREATSESFQYQGCLEEYQVKKREKGAL